jgi:hypothetical protein
MTADPHLIAILQAITATGAWVAGLIFFRFWRETGDRLLALFAFAFWLLSASWLLLAVLDPTDEARPYVYAVRLLGFLLIIAAVVDKNRHRRQRP